MTTSIIAAPCTPWVMPTGCCDVCDDTDPLLAEFWEMFAEWAFVETCHQYTGACAAEVEPCAPCGCATGSCRCRYGPSIDLTGVFCAPIRMGEDGQPLIEVVIDGAVQPGWVLETDDVTLTAPRDIGSWPQTGTWSIRATIGQDPPAMLLRGVAMLACEFVKDCQGKESCLPDGVTSITRRGQNIDMQEFSDTIRFSQEGTGIHILDKALEAFGCEDAPVHAHWNPLDNDDRYGSHARWEFRGVRVPTPVGAQP